MQGAIHQSIEWLDKLGMNAIEQVRRALRHGRLLHSAAADMR